MPSLPAPKKTHTLTISFMLIIFLFLSFGIFTIKGLFTLGNLTREIYEHPLVVSNASLNAALNITKMHRSMKDAVLSNTREEMEITLKDVSLCEQKVFQQLDTVRDNILGNEGKILEKQARQLFVNWQPIRKEVVQLLKSGRKQDAVFLTRTKGADHVAELEAKTLELTSYARKKAANFLEVVEKSQAKLEKITVILTLAGVLLSALIAFIAAYRVLKAENVLIREKNKLREALDEIKTLRGIIPICSHCRQIRDDEGMWKMIEEYIHEKSDASFSHGICPDCMRKYYPRVAASINSDTTQEK